MTIRKKIITILVFAIALSSAILVSCCQIKHKKIVEETRFLMGTDVQIKVSVDEKADNAKIRSAVDKAFKEIERIENIFSVYKSNSEISKINRLRKKERLVISKEAFELIKISIDYSNKTEGAFDITVKPLVDLWKKAEGDKKIPSDDEIKAALAHTGYKNVMLDESSHTISFAREEMALDLGGVAKGYASGKAIKVLDESGIKNAIVGTAGDLYCSGEKADNEFWTVAIRHPRDKDKVFMDIKLSGKAIDTSGDYEKYFILNNKRYSHIIDPRTGYPVGDDVISSTVIADDPAVSDMLSTALMILGEKGLNIAESMKSIDAVIVLKRGNRLLIKTTDGLSKHYAIKEKKL